MKREKVLLNTQGDINLLLVERLVDELRSGGFRILTPQPFIQSEGYFAVMAVVGVTSRLLDSKDIIMVHWDNTSEATMSAPRLVPSLVERVYWAVVVQVPVGCTRIGWIKTDCLDSNRGEGFWIDIVPATRDLGNKLLLIESSESRARGLNIRYAVGALSPGRTGLRLLYVERIPFAETEKDVAFGCN